MNNIYPWFLNWSAKYKLKKCLTIHAALSSQRKVILMWSDVKWSTGGDIKHLLFNEENLSREMHSLSEGDTLCSKMGQISFWQRKSLVVVGWWAQCGAVRSSRGEKTDGLWLLNMVRAARHPAEFIFWPLARASSDPFPTINHTNLQHSFIRLPQIRWRSEHRPVLFLTSLPAKRSQSVSPSTCRSVWEGRFLAVSDHVEMIEQDIRAVLEPNFSPSDSQILL